MWIRRVALALLGLSLSATVAWAQDATPNAESAATTDTGNTYTSEDGRLTLSYPEGWISDSRNEGDAYFANSEAALLHSYGDPFANDEIQVALYTGHIRDFLPETDEDEVVDASALELLNAAVAEATVADNTEFEATEPVELNGLDAAGVRFYSDAFEGYALIIAFGDETYAAMQAITIKGEFHLWEQKFTELIESIRYDGEPGGESGDGLELTQNYAAEDGLLTVNYPEGWAARESFPPGVDLASSEAALDLWLYDSFAPGDVHMSIAYGNADELFEETPGGDPSALELLEFAITSEPVSDERITSVEAAEALTVNAHPAAQTRVTVGDSTNYFVVIEYSDEMFVTAQAQSTTEEIARWEVLLIDILSTLEVGAAS
jgi:hypothetical protein